MDRKQSIIDHDEFRNYILKIGIAYKNQYIKDFAIQLDFFFRKKQIESNCYSNIDSAIADNCNCIIVVNPIDFRLKRKKRKVTYVCIQTEQLFEQKKGAYQFGRINIIKLLLRGIRRYDLIFDFQKSNVRVLKNKLHVKRDKLDLLPAPFFSISAQDIHKESVEKYDLIFIGNLEDKFGFKRRKIILQDLSKKYSIYPKTDGLWGEEKNRAIKESRICLNIHTDEGRYDDSLRIIDYINAGGFVLSERIEDPQIFKEDEDFVTFSLYDLYNKIDYYLEHTEERERIKNNAIQKINSIDPEKNADALLDRIVLTRVVQLATFKEKIYPIYYLIKSFISNRSSLK